MSDKVQDVAVGDVWQSNGGALKIRALAIEFEGACLVVRWEGVNRRESGKCSLANFRRKRRLIERDGKRVEPADAT